MNDTVNYQSIFCERLKSARLAKGLSQKKLGILAGLDEFVASTRINRYEKGVHQAGTEVVHQLALALDVPSAYFYVADDQLAQVVLSWNQLDSDTRAKIMALVS
ncbi:helix-turn-helix protein [Yokenella regensburgei]|uniref:Helix-turn-helix protein n=1 Tax=Yokenella regensburgei TaxID=158877 RepID=A0ABX9RWD1_9ENTR|nr:helix-turn-helix transcriptional regulator [Yokenella regensburgei]RKR53853.1 helix-turn-helix protein [Yokenella regensburgei]VFS30055.1 Helix-turn-helix domain [Yokenella regensburgei]